MVDFRKLSISVIAAISLVIVTTVILSLFGWLDYNLEKSRRQESLRKSLLTQTDQLSAGLTIPIWNIDRAQIAKIIESAMSDPEVYQVRVNAADEVYVRRRGPDGKILDFADDRPKGDILVSTRSLFFADEKIGTLEVFVTPELVNQSLRERGKRYAGLILLVDFTLIVSLYFILWKIVLKPLRQVERYAVAVSSESDAKDILKGTTFHAELEILRASIEKMVCLLETRIYAIKESEEGLKAAKERAESADRIKSEFLDIAAHELKTPLTPLTVLLQLAHYKFKAREPISEEIWDRMSLQVERLTALVRDLLDVSRLESGTFPMNPRSFDLRQLVSRCVQDFRDQSEKRIIFFEAKSEPIEVEADPTRIYEVVANLIDNAIKYTSADSPIEAKISTLSEERVRVSVTDHGQGISRDQRKALFTRFFRVSSDATIQHSGLGLGLYICRRILELHQGIITVESELGKGSTFIFELPTRMSK